jgi:hypothetical protein
VTGRVIETVTTPTCPAAGFPINMPATLATFTNPERIFTPEIACQENPGEGLLLAAAEGDNDAADLGLHHGGETRPLPARHDAGGERAGSFERVHVEDGSPVDEVASKAKGP